MTRMNHLVDEAHLQQQFHDYIFAGVVNGDVGDDDDDGDGDDDKDNRFYECVTVIVVHVSIPHISQMG